MASIHYLALVSRISKISRLVVFLERPTGFSYLTTVDVFSKMVTPANSRPPALI